MATRNCRKYTSFGVAIISDRNLQAFHYYAMAERGGVLKDLASKQAFDYALNMGRGSVWLSLTDEQHRKLTRRR